ncbi:major facilitator superfamily domain-containing protein 10-like [Argopecten irradians]|uniref:major facilitator superfamily domain-containing protein 10-like n=1 Tax=Argopecten irradians TaxID=31199 RepID=UPI00371AB949
MQQGKMFFFIGTVMALVQGGYVRRIQSGKQLRIATIGMSLLIPAFVIMAFAHSAVLMYLALMLFAFASATVVPCLTTLISEYGGSDQKGVILGVFRSLGALARAIGPVVSSVVYWSCGDKNFNEILHKTSKALGQSQIVNYMAPTPQGAVGGTKRYLMEPSALLRLKGL